MGSTKWINAQNTSGWYCKDPFTPQATCVQCTPANPGPVACWASDEATCKASPSCTPGSQAPIQYKCVNHACTPCAAGQTCQYKSSADCTMSTCQNKYKCVTQANGAAACTLDPNGTLFAEDCGPKCTAIVYTPGSSTSVNLRGKCTAANSIDTAIGCVPISDLNSFAAFFLRWGLGIAGGIGILFLVYASFMVMTSQGDPKRLQVGRELLMSAVSGIILLALSVFIFRIIGINLLGLF